MTFKTLAEAIFDFSNHHISRIEFYELISKLIVESTEGDKQDYAQSTEGKIPLTKYQAAKKWLNKDRKL